MSMRALDVRINDQLVGQLREDDNIWELEYADVWRTQASGFDLSPALSRATALHRDGSSNRPVQWYFDNLLPEETMRAMVAKDAKIDAEDSFGLLAYYGRESAGSIVLDAPGSNSALSERGLRPLSRKELSRRIADMPRVSLSSGAPKKMSLAGAQHKLLVVLKGDELFEPKAGTASTHILKPEHGGEDYPCSVINEYFTMRLAKDVGLDVPTVRRMYAPQPVYLVARFDRIMDKKNGEVKRLHAIDTCQLLNKSRTFKYHAADVTALSSAIKLCRQKAGARIKLFKWLAFNILVGNGDNHLKNISFIVESGDIRVAPAYDLLSTSVYETMALADDKAQWPQTSLALMVGSAKTFAEVTREDVLTAAAQMGLSRRTAQRELDRLITAMPIAADRLINEISARMEDDIATSPDQAVAQTFVAGEQRLLRAIRHIIINDMVKSLA